MSNALAVMRNLLLVGGVCTVLGFALPRHLHLFADVRLDAHLFFWPGGFLLAEGLLILF